MVKGFEAGDGGWILWRVEIDAGWLKDEYGNLLGSSLIWFKNLAPQMVTGW